ncbi:hypothetical protein [Microbacterium sp. TNHR37B]|uniref:hypothetical protein n=1 Tax=Microbacterium sp. TNHR37B TaxID=1775956 RepID=UPI0018D4CF7F|nr:hypothetical protein [Microbacterium sp. TNHR37B]
MWAPTSADATVYVLDFAPGIAFPLRFHWYEKVGFGDHVPGRVVSRAPKTGWPEITGVGADEKAAFLTVFAALVRDVLTYPDRLPVTVTATFLPASAATILYDLDLAPEMGLPFRNH